MKSGPQQESAQAMQRVRVGMTGLAMVLVLIGLASALFSAANHDKPVTAIGASNASIVANMTDGANIAVAKPKDEPLADLGVAPSAATADSANAAEAAKHRH